MSKYRLPHFGELDIDYLQEYYNAEIELSECKIEWDLNFEEKSIIEQKLEIVKNFIENLGEINLIATKAIEGDFKLGGIVKDYIEHHLEEFDEGNLAYIIDNSNKKISKEEQMLLNIHLKRVGFYPKNENQFAVFDYTVSQDLTNYLIVIKFKKDGEIDHVTMES